MFSRQIQITAPQLLEKYRSDSLDLRTWVHVPKQDFADQLLGSKTLTGRIGALRIYAGGQQTMLKFKVSKFSPLNGICLESHFT